VRHEGEKSAEEHYEEAAGRNAYSVARCTSAYHGCMLEPGRAFNATSIFVFREFSSDVWTGCVKHWPEFIVIGVRDCIGDHAHGRKVELEAVGSEWARALAGRIEAIRHTEDLWRMRNEAEERINSGESEHGDLSWTGAGIESPTENLWHASDPLEQTGAVRPIADQWDPTGF
jgi:hypothetical protein